MTSDKPATIRMFGLLHTIRKQKGLPVTVELHLPPEGKIAKDIAMELQLPTDKIEAVFCNHLAYSLEHIILPGDRAAFIPHGTPGPHRYCLGIKQAGDMTK